TCYLQGPISSFQNSHLLPASKRDRFLSSTRSLKF
ncbi:hypothetical protein Gorai_011219, partial [Gossypium raimondii]|nr:hypothetical protein [Gossypium raimondii]